MKNEPHVSKSPITAPNGLKPIVHYDQLLCEQIAQATKEVAFSRAMLAIGHADKITIKRPDKCDEIIEHFAQQTKKPDPHTDSQPQNQTKRGGTIKRAIP